MPLTKRSTVHAVGRGALTPPHKNDGTSVERRRPEGRPPYAKPDNNLTM